MLGVTIEDKLNFKGHVTESSKKFRSIKSSK